MSLSKSMARPPSENDLVFEGEEDQLARMEAELEKAMHDVGIDPAKIHAFRKTGRLVSTENQHLLSDQELAEWDAAVKEYTDFQNSGERRKDPAPGN